MRRRLLAEFTSCALGLALLYLAMSGSPLASSADTASANASASVAAVERPSEFGAPIEGTRPTPLAEILDQPERYTESRVLLRGRVADVCQKKGCWTVLQDGDATVRVRFVDYGFFLPKDIRGREAWVEGTVTVRTLSERDARHYAAESMTGDPDAIEGPQLEVGFLASGVRVLPPS